MRSYYRSAKMELWLRLLPKLRLMSETMLVNESGQHRLSPTPGAAPPTQVSKPLYVESSSSNAWPKLPTKSNKANDAADTESQLVTGSDGSMLSLSAIIAVGCSFLFLNIVVFVSAHYQKERLRTQLRNEQDKLAMLKESPAKSCDSDSSSAHIPFFQHGYNSDADTKRPNPINPPRLHAAFPRTKSLPDTDTVRSPNKLSKKTSVSTEFTNRNMSILHGPSTLV